MTPIQVIALLLVAVGGLAVVTTREPGRQALVLSIYGLALTVTFFLFQAPDVALSELTIGAVVLPLLILLAVAKTRSQSR